MPTAIEAEGALTFEANSLAKVKSDYELRSKGKAHSETSSPKHSTQASADQYNPSPADNVMRAKESDVQSLKVVESEIDTDGEDSSAEEESSEGEGDGSEWDPHEGDEEHEDVKVLDSTKQPGNTVIPKAQSRDQGKKDDTGNSKAARETRASVGQGVKRKSRKINPKSKRQLNIKLKTLRKKCRELRRFKKTDEKRIKSLEQEKKRLRQAMIEQIETHGEELAAREQGFQEAQKDYLKLVKKGSIAAMPDNDVRSELEQVMNLCRQWAKKYALASTKNLSSEQMEAAVQSLTMPESQRLASEKAVQLLKDHKLSSKMVLNAVLSRDITLTLLENPFFFLGRTAPSGGLDYPKNAERVLEWVQEMGQLCVGDKAHMWRALTMQMLDPPNHVPRPGDDTDRHKLMNGLREAFYEQRVEIFRKKHADAFCEPLQGDSLMKRHKSLEAIFRKAGTLAAKLAAQNVEIQVMCLDWLFVNTGNAFSIDSDFMQADYTMRCEDDDHSWDNWPLDFLVEPAILAYGDEHGENYDDDKVWTKARVWIDIRNLANVENPGPVTKQTNTKGKKPAQRTPKGKNASKPTSATNPIVITGDEDIVAVVEKVVQSGSIKNTSVGSTRNAQLKAHQSASPKASSSSSSQVSKTGDPKTDGKPTHDSSHDPPASTRSENADRQTSEGRTSPEKAQVKPGAEVDQTVSSPVEAPKAEGSKKRKLPVTAGSEDATATKEAKKQKGDTAAKTAESSKEDTKQEKKGESGQQKVKTKTEIGNGESSKDDTKEGKKDESGQQKAKTETGSAESSKEDTKKEKKDASGPPKAKTEISKET